MHTRTALLLGLVLSAASVALSGQAPAHHTAKAEVYFVTPKSGDVVTSPFLVRFGLKGMDVAPAGVVKPNSGHHHLLVDLEKLPDLSKPLPANDNIRHFGGGQTETMLSLPAGTHTLQLLVADAGHVAHTQPVMSEKITVTVR